MTPDRMSDHYRIRNEALASEVSRLRSELEELRRESGLTKGGQGPASLCEEVVDNADALICVFDRQGQVLIWNKTAERISGYSREAILGTGRFFDLLFTDLDRAREFQRVVIDVCHSDRSLENFETEIRGGGGERRIIAWNLRCLGAADENAIAVVAIGNDVTEQKLNQVQMEQLAFYDTLTKLPNRRLFRNRVQHALAAAQRTGARVAVMFLDLDKFKRVNDSLGHEAGDELLRQVAARIRRCVRKQDTVARLGGDEFTVLLPEITDATVASMVAAKIADILHEPIDIAGQEVFITSSIGLSIAPDDCDDEAGMLRNADLAMYRAKERGRNTVQYFTEELNEIVSRRLFLENELRAAMRQQDFALHYQPVFAMDGRSIVGLEALLRWRHGSRGLIFPGEFLTTLEETGLIVPVGTWVIEEACRKARSLQERYRPLPIAVNLSLRQFHQPDLPETIRGILEAQGLSPGLLHVEITESMLMEDLEQTLKVLRALKELGLWLYIDDFGAGYSSLNHLKQFPVDVVKVDRSFVRNIPDEPQDMEITGAVIAMAHKLQLRVIAEGVETQEQLDFLNESGCDQVQGYFCSVPLDEDGLDYLMQVEQ